MSSTSNVSTSVPSLPASSPQAIEQYKAKLTDLGNIGLRQASTTTYYVSIVSALLGIFAFRDRPLAEVDIIVLLTICVAGCLVSCLWFFSLTFFRSLFRAKIEVLKEMEETLPFQTFRSEFESMKKFGNTSWLWIERLVPVVFALFFLLLFVARLLLYFGCIR